MVKHENIPPLIIPTRYFSIDLNAITPIIKPLPAIAAPVSTYHNNIKKDVVLPYPPWQPVTSKKEPYANITAAITDTIIYPKTRNN